VVRAADVEVVGDERFEEGAGVAGSGEHEGVSGVLCNGGEISEVMTGIDRFSRKVAVDDERVGARRAGACRAG
jgi:hypothetical protein